MKKFLTFVIILLNYYQYTAGGKIKGRVLDKETGEVLVGATLYIKELNKGVLSGLDGTFLINNLPEGRYNLLCSFLGYNKQEKLIIIKDSSTIVNDFYLVPVSSEIDQVVVTANSLKNTEIGAKLSEQKSNQIINVLSARTIELYPDINLAGILQRMSGVVLDRSSSISTGKYTLLRGMDMRYNYTLVNGIKIPSTHHKHRYVSMDLFPSDMIDKVEVIKSVTPDMESDAIAGAVNLVMKNSEKTSLRTNLAIGYNTFFYDNSFKTFNTNAINIKSPYERNGYGYMAKPSDFNTENLKIKEISHPLNYLGSITIARRHFNKKLGYTLTGSLQKLFNTESTLYFSDELSRDGLNLPILKEMQERLYYEKRSNIGLHGLVDYKLTGKSNIQAYAFYILSDRAQIREVQNTNLMVSYEPDKGNLTRSHSSRFRFNSQSLFSITLQATHNVFENFKIQWSLAHANAINRTPEEATVIYYNSLYNYEVKNQFVDFDGSSRIWRRNLDKDFSVYINLDYVPENILNNTNFKIGGMYRIKDRNSFYNKYVLKAIVDVNYNDSSYISYYSEKGVHWNTFDQIQWQVYNPRGTIAVGENYDATEEVYAVYFMFKSNFGKINFTSGIRLENIYQGYKMRYPIGESDPVGSKNYLELLPSFNCKYLINSKNNIKISYYKAINKPGFHEIVPYIDSSEEPNSAGNKSLKHAVADNIDFRIENFSNGIDQIMISFFYKHIRNPIEFAFEKYRNVSQNIVFMPVNSEKAINYGVEIDFVKFVREWGVRANYTNTQSSITTNKLSRIKDDNGNDSTIYVKQTRPLYGQAENVANVSLLYKGIKNGINAQMSMSYIGDRIYSISRFIDNDMWQKGFWQIDMSVEKNFKKGFSIYFKTNNLISTHTIVYIRKINPINYDVPYQNDKYTLIRDEYSKPAFLFGIKFKY